MNPRWAAYAALVVAAVVAAVFLGLATGALAPYLGVGYDASVSPADSGYDHVTVTVVDGETGAERGAVEAAVADTFAERYVGLSETDRLPEDRGMWFVHDDAGEYTYVMRNMSFGLDIVFVAPDGTITAIHDAPEPGPGEDGADQEYTGEGRYVLEVNRGWTAERGIEEGDRIVVE